MTTKIFLRGTAPFHKKNILLKKNSKNSCLLKKNRTFAVSKETNASLAQLVEQLTLNQWVQGSSP